MSSQANPDELTLYKRVVDKVNSSISGRSANEITHVLSNLDVRWNTEGIALITANIGAQTSITGAADEIDRQFLITASHWRRAFIHGSRCVRGLCQRLKKIPRIISVRRERKFDTWRERCCAYNNPKGTSRGPRFS